MTASGVLSLLNLSDELIAANETAYIETAVAIADSQQRQNEIRRAVRERLPASGLLENPVRRR